ncbi:MAG: MGMT family protein [Gammaproteobacteria bacterium]
MDTQEYKDRILQTIAAIPRGRVCTYGKVAQLAGLPRHARFVGTLLKNLPSGSKIPWHRVINSQGRISFPEGSDAFAKQVQRLEAEGVILTGGKYNLRHYLWNP